MGNHPPFPSMPFMEAFSPLLHFFKGLARKGPGSETSTLRALERCKLPDRPRVADLGCGSGAATLVLARKLSVPILALDADGISLDDLWEAAHAQGLLPWVEPCCGDMADAGLPAGHFDLIWSEGAIAHIGWARGLPLWRALLRPGGFMAVSDATWLTTRPPEEARKAWHAWYPAMGTVEEKLRRAHKVGLEVVGHFVLPPEDWWAYFEPIESRCRASASQDSFREIVAGMRREMDLYRRLGHSYGYVFYVMRRI